MVRRCWRSWARVELDRSYGRKGRMYPGVRVAPRTHCVAWRAEAADAYRVVRDVPDRHAVPGHRQGRGGGAGAAPASGGFPGGPDPPRPDAPQHPPPAGGGGGGTRGRPPPWGGSGGGAPPPPRGLRWVRGRPRGG